MERRKKILFLVTQSEFGGAQRFIYTLVTSLLRRDTQIESQQVENTQIHAEDAEENELLYADITYKIRGACFKIWKEFRGAYKEKIIERALAKELQIQGLNIDTQKQIPINYENENMGKYVPDMIVDDKVLVELKSKTFITKEDEKQFWLYLKGSNYKLGLLINFGNKLEIKRRVYDTARDISAPISVSPKADNLRVSANYEIVVGAGKEGDDENGLLNLLEKQGIKVERLKNLRRSINPFFDLLGFFEIRKLLKKEKPDILFLCSSKAGFIGSLAARLCRRSTQIEFASQNTQINAEYQRESAYSKEDNPRVSAKLPKVIYRIGGWSFNDPRNFLINSYLKFLERISAQWKDYIINNAESDRQQAIKLGIRPKKEILTIHNGIDVDGLEFLSKDDARIQISKILKLNQNSKLEIQNFVVGTIANDYPAKGLKYLRGAEKKLSEFKFVILSGVPNAYKYLKAFDIFVLPSVKEGFPWVVLEAMTAEIPVIATNVGAVPEIIINEENGLLINPNNTEQIVEAIKRLCGDEELKRKLIKNAKETVVERFNLSKMVKQYEDLFSIG